MILPLEGVLHKWKIDTGEKIIDSENLMRLNDHSTYLSCVVYDVNSEISIYDNGSDKGAVCTKRQQDRCSECIFGELKENEFYKAERRDA